MFKGVGKQVVVLKNPDSKLFEQAIFILRDKPDKSKRELLAECERIISMHSTGGKQKKKKHYKQSIIPLISMLGALMLFILSVILLFGMK